MHCSQPTLTGNDTACHSLTKASSARFYYVAFFRSWKMDSVSSWSTTSLTSKMVFVHLHRRITSGWSAGRLSEIWLHLLVRGVVQNVGQAVVVAFEATSPSLWVLSQRSVHLIICADGGPLLKGVLCVNLLSLIWNRTQVIHCLSTPAGRSLYCIATVFDSVHRTYFIHRPVCEDGVAELEKGRKLSILSRSWAFWSGTISVEEKQGWK